MYIYKHIYRYSTRPQMFTVEAVSAAGVYEWAYACGKDVYLHTGWASDAGAGPPVVCVRLRYICIYIYIYIYLSLSI